MEETRKTWNGHKKEEAAKSVTLNIGSRNLVLNGLWQWDMQSDALYSSDVMAFPPDFEGTKSIVHPDDLPRLGSALESLAGGEINTLDFRIITTYGEVKHISGKRIALQKSDGREQIPAGIPAEEALHELALRKEAEYLSQRTVLANSAEKLYGTGSWALNKSTGEAWYSDGMYGLHGLPPQSLNAHANTFNSFLHPDDRNAVLDVLEKAYAAELPVHLEYRIVLTDGAVRHLRQVTGWSFNRQGQSLLGGIVRDLTSEQALAEGVQEAEATLRLHQQMLRFGEQHWHTGYWFMNLVTRKVAYSENYYRIYGLKQPQLHNNVFLNLVHPDDRVRVQRLMDDVYRKHELPETEYRIIRPDGKQRYLKQSGKIVISGEAELMMVGLVQDLTVQKGLEKKIAELTETAALQTIVKGLTETFTAASSVVWYPGDGRIWWSEGFYHLLGHRPDSAEPSLRLLHQQIHPEDLKAFKTAETLVLNGQNQEELFFRLVNKGGVRQLRIAFTRVTAGSTEAVVGVVREMTKEVLLHEKLFNTAAYAEKLADNVSDLVILTDTANNVVYWNEVATQKTGIKKDEALYQNLFDLFPALKDSRYNSQLQLVIDGREINEPKASDRYLKRPHHYCLSPVKAEKGDVVWVLHVVRDISKELGLQRQLSERLNFIESLVEASVDRIVVLDRNMNYLYWNGQAEDWYAIKKERVIGKNILEVFPSFRNHPDYAGFRRVLRGETVYLPPAETEKGEDYVETYLIPVKDEGGEVTAILWTVHDLRNEWQLGRERAAAQARLAEEHRRLREAQAIGSVGSFEWTVGEPASHWSDELFRIHGLTPGETETTLVKVHDFIHPDDKEAVQATMDESVQKPGSYAEVHRIITQSSEVRWVNHRWQSLADKEGKVVNVKGIVQDITERKNAEEEIKGQSHFINSVTKAVPDLISIVEMPSRKLLYFNHEPELMTGFTVQEVEKMSDEERLGYLVHPDDRPVLNAFYNQLEALAEGDIAKTEYRCRKKGGGPFWLHVRGMAFQRDGDGRLTQALVVGSDVSERKKAEQKLQESTALQKAVFNTVRHAITVFEAIRNEAGRIVDFRYILSNGVADRFMHISTEGKTLRTVTPGYFDEVNFAAMTEAVETGRVTEKELHFTYGDNPVYLHTQYLKLNDGVVLVHEDVTERKKAEQEILRLKDEVAQKATDKYLTLFNSIDEAVVWCELITDEAGKAVDYRMLEINPAFEKMTGITREAAKGKTAKEVVPTIESWWIETYARVALEGETMRIENKVAELGRWFNAYASPVGNRKDKQFVLVYTDITERKRHEQQQEYLLGLSDALRPVAEPLAIQAEACRILRKQLGGIRVAYAEMKPDGLTCTCRAEDVAGGTVSVMPFTLSWADFDPTGLAVVNEGKTIIQPDVQADADLSPAQKAACAAFGFRAYLIAPLVKAGRMIAFFVVHFDHPHTASPLEICLLEETAERTWAAVERAKAEEALRESEERLQLSIKGANLLAWEVDPQTGAIKYSDNFNEVLGFEISKVSAENFINIYPEDEAFVMQAIGKALKGEAPLDVEHRVINPQTKEVIWVRAQGQLTGHSATATPVFIGITQNITTRKMAEEALLNFNATLERQVTERTAEIEKNLAILRQTEDIAAIGSWEYQIPSGRFSWSDGMYRIFDYPMGAPVQPEAYIHSAVKEDKPAARRLARYIKSGRQNFEETLSIKRSDGERRLLKVKGTVVKDEEGRPLKVVGVDLDITDLKVAEDKVREQSRYAQTIIDASIDQITVFDKDYRFLAWNKRAEENGGLRKEDVIGKSLFDVFPTVKDDAEFMQAQERSLAGEYVYIPAKRGIYSTSYQEWFYVPLKNEKGETYAVLNIIHDISKRVQAEEELHQKARQLEAKNEEITNFAFIASHDLKEPIRKIHTFSNWLMEREADGLSTKGKEYAFKIFAAVKRLDGLIDDITTLTRLQSLKTAPAEVALDAVLAEAKADLKEEIEAAGAVIESKALPIISGNRGQLVQLFRNIVGNAIKFQEPGVMPVIEIACEKRSGIKDLPPGDWYELRFTDNGIGFDMQYAEKIFRVFQRLHGQSQYPGSGIGLAICKKIMETHGGDIKAESTPGKSSVFTCYFSAEK